MDHSASSHASAPVPDPAVMKAAPASDDVRKPRWLREAEVRLRNHRSILETLTEEDWEFLRNYDGPEVLGPPPPPPMKRRPRRRDER
jgi:hypothetical protein